ncbi:hypothetical protein [Megasphaera sp. SW808]|uniref:hypothetical protein n=1 Tax=Megasphaera sp. SW808 TaxID=2530045 RepID=UPI001980D704|nr:hypothetical protein [Megasphaera sp. SW808]
METGKTHHRSHRPASPRIRVHSPLIDGNGRTGRLLLNFELIKNGLLPIDIKFTDRRKYYDCFDAYHADNKNPEKMVSLIAEYEKVELERYIKIIKQ